MDGDKVVVRLKGEGKIHDERIEKLMKWRHSGFSVHAGDRIARDDRDGQKALAEYILRNAFSGQKITYPVLFVPRRVNVGQGD